MKFLLLILISIMLYWSLGLRRIGTSLRTQSLKCASSSGGNIVNVLVPIANGSEEIESVTIINTLVRAGALVTVASVERELQAIK